MMFALLSLVVCLAGQPANCETVTPDYVHQDTGQLPTLFECLGVGGQGIARKWLDEHPGYRLHRIQCSIANHADRLRDRIASGSATAAAATARISKAPPNTNLERARVEVATQLRRTINRPLTSTTRRGPITVTSLRTASGAKLRAAVTVDHRSRAAVAQCLCNLDRIA
jgi:hypothetical protein